MKYLTIDTSILGDGFGSQYQRIFGTISLALELNFEYVHTTVTYLYLENSNYIKDIDEYFCLKYFKNVKDITYNKIIRLHNPTLNDFKNIEDNTLVIIEFPYNILENNLHIYYKGINKLLPIKNNINNLDNNTIGIHIRRNEIINMKDRFISIDFYKNLIDKLNLTFKKSTFYIVSDNNHLNEFDVFNEFTNLNIINKENLIKSFDILTNVNKLIISKSSFSYLAGLYNKNSVYYIDFWHKKLPHWKNLTEL
jgi:hypothetical protein